MQKVVVKSLLASCIAGLMLVAGPVSASESKKTEIVLSPNEQTQADLWDLSKDDYQRFKAILQSPRAYTTPKLDKNPVLALGVMARSPQERKKYADKWVKIQFEQNVQTIVWALEVEEAWERNYPGIPRFTYGLHDKKHHSASEMVDKASAFDRKKIWLKVDDCGSCETELANLLRKLSNKSISGIDIFIEGIEASNVNNKIVGRWAAKNGISQKVVQKQIVTLNYATRNKRPNNTQLPHIE
ncbi:hypothetical protein OPW39_15895 [Vibrio europaeus]|uniref:hypothetical protein n=1 Tax=Vibrio europaeus TaxID=300876 RepID=UPI00233E9F41|nr:hypothetical protein [Vibrio europaeus]MDC5870291.1 hypothetical protein [Vibrio europaeus]